MMFEQKYCRDCCCVGVYFFDLWIFTLQKDLMEPNSSKHGRRHRVGVTYNVSLWGGWPLRGLLVTGMQFWCPEVNYYTWRTAHTMDDTIGLTQDSVISYFWGSSSQTLLATILSIDFFCLATIGVSLNIKISAINFFLWFQTNFELIFV